jgi:serine protease Do
MAHALDENLAELAERVRRSTVQVYAERRGGGSGVVWNDDGAIVTNAHVVGTAREVTIETNDGRTFRGAVALRDERTDLAEVAPAVAVDGLRGATIGHAGSLRVGDVVAALGAPLGIAGALTLGIVHRAAVDGKGLSRRWLEADLRLAPGNSGGPMVDALGRVVGINSMIADGLALAIPSETVERFVRTRGARAWLGVTTQPVRLREPIEKGVARANGATVGFVILELAPRSPAQHAGLALGDVIVRIGGVSFDNPWSFGLSIDNIGPGDTIGVEILRGAKLLTVNVATGTQTARIDRAA